MSSKHEAIVFKLTEFDDCPNSDNLKIIKIPETAYNYVCNYQEWKERLNSNVCFIEPDSLVDTCRSEFSFLADKAKYDEDSNLSPEGTWARVRAIKLRGNLSFGIVTTVPPNLKPGDDATEALNVHHYEAPVSGSSGGGGFITGGESAPRPDGLTWQSYDIENYKKYVHHDTNTHKVFQEDEPIYATLKMHGCYSGFVYHNSDFHCASSSGFKREYPTKPVIDEQRVAAKYGEKSQEVIDKINIKLNNWKPKQSLWWKVLRENENLQKFLQDNPSLAVFGEIVGIQGDKFKYGLKPGTYKLYVFDLYKDGKYIDAAEARDLGKDLTWVPIIKYNHPFNHMEMMELVENLPVILNPLEEGIVIKSRIEQYHPLIGRKQLKLISSKYLEKS
jgi:RNA ligase (TIGR02306 family)